MTGFEIEYDPALKTYKYTFRMPVSELPALEALSGQYELHGRHSFFIAGDNKNYWTPIDFKVAPPATPAP